MSASVTLAGVPVEEPHAKDMRFAALIWGPAGSGKTILASTAPGDKLLLCFDPDGDVSLADRSDVKVMRLYTANPLTVAGEFRKSDPYTLTRYLTERPELATVVFDSMTTYADMALRVAVQANQTGRNTISVEQPSIAGWSYRNQMVKQCANNMLALTAKLGRNIIFTTHEGSPQLDDKGAIESITMILSTNLANEIGLRINEIWHLRDNDGRSRVISVRPHLKMKPMKTRMFNATTPQFTWHFDANTMVGEGIADWWLAWKNNGGQKLALPTVAQSTTSKGGQKKAPTR